MCDVPLWNLLTKQHKIYWKRLSTNVCFWCVWFWPIKINKILLKIWKAWCGFLKFILKICHFMTFNNLSKLPLQSEICVLVMGVFYFNDNNNKVREQHILTIETFLSCILSIQKCVAFNVNVISKCYDIICLKLYCWDKKEQPWKQCFIVYCLMQILDCSVIDIWYCLPLLVRFVTTDNEIIRCPPPAQYGNLLESCVYTLCCQGRTRTK